MTAFRYHRSIHPFCIYQPEVALRTHTVHELPYIFLFVSLDVQHCNLGNR